MRKDEFIGGRWKGLAKNPFSLPRDGKKRTKKDDSMKKFLFVVLVLLCVTCFCAEVTGADPNTWVQGGTVTSGYCERTRNGNQETHPGVDIAKLEPDPCDPNRTVSVEAPVKAGCAGTVVKVYKFTGTHYRPGTGATNAEWLSNFNMVVVKCEDGTYTVFAHLSSIDVNEGAAVTADTQIGKIGGYGYNCKDTFGNHVHVERRTDATGNGDWDPNEENLVRAGSKDHATNPIPGEGNRNAGLERTGGGGGFHQYTVVNEANSCCPIWYVRIDYGGAGPYEASSPEGWQASTWSDCPNWVEWQVSGPLYAIVPGDELSGFGFSSPDREGMVNFFLDYDDAGYGSGLSDVTSTKVMGVSQAGYTVVDDMESYCRGVGCDNYIYDTWFDGFALPPVNNSGSEVGLGIDPTEPVHGGTQSMVYVYDSGDTGGYGLDYYSEIEREFSDPCDWTAFGVKALTLFFYGDADNDANDTEQMYAGLEDTRGGISYAQVNYGLYGEDMNDIKKEEWQEWNIALTDFTGVDANNVKKIYIGFGIRGNTTVPGGNGTVIFDDIRLYLPKCIPLRLKPVADLSDNCLVDFADIGIMALDWLETEHAQESPANLYNAEPPELQAINFRDFAVLMEDWLEVKFWPPE